VSKLLEQDSLQAGCLTSSEKMCLQTWKGNILLFLNLPENDNKTSINSHRPERRENIEDSRT